MGLFVPMHQVALVRVRIQSSERRHVVIRLSSGTTNAHSQTQSTAAHLPVGRYMCVIYYGGHGSANRGRLG
jgi:effector-binding domain-containing protein